MTSVNDNTAPVGIRIGWMFLLAILVGVFGGVGAVVLDGFIALVHNAALYGELSGDFDETQFLAPSRWGAGVVLVPVVGAIAVTWIARTYSAEAVGSGVPEVLNAIHYNQGRIPPRVVLAKALTSAISIGTGGSVGREGPAIQIGSAFASTLGQWVSMPARQRVILVAAGAASGIAATFNAPLAGLAFAIELMLVSVSAPAVALVAVAAVTATFVGQWHHGMLASLANALPTATGTESYTLLIALPFGVVCGLASAALLSTLSRVEDVFQHRFQNPYLRHAVGMLAVGCLMYGFFLAAGHYYVGGIGYATVTQVMAGVLADPWLLACLFLAKLLATCLTLGTGASGGVFSPSLFLGATLGAAFAHALNAVIPALALEPAVFAMAGMAAIVTGTTGAVLTGIIMLFEQTRDYGAILPIIAASALAFVVRERLVFESIYTLRLAKRGVWLPHGLQANTANSRHARSLMNTSFQLVELSELPDWQARHSPGEAPRYSVLVEQQRVVGVAREELRYLMRDRDIEDLLDRNVFLVDETTPLAVILRGLQRKNGSRAIVMRQRGSDQAGDVVGVIGSREIFNAVQEGVSLMDH